MITEIADGTWTCAVIDAKKFGAGHDMGIAALDTETGEHLGKMRLTETKCAADFRNLLAGLLAGFRRRHFDRGDSQQLHLQSVRVH